MSLEQKKEYSPPFRVLSKPYTLDKEIDTIEVEDMVVLDSGCVSLLVLKPNGEYQFYFPYSDQERFKEVESQEAKALFDKIKSKPSNRERPSIDRDIDIRISEVDCLGNLWVLSSQNILYHFINPHLFKSYRYSQRTFKSKNSRTVWSNLYIDCDIPKGTDIYIKIIVGEKIIKFKNLTNIFLGDLVGESLKYRVILHSSRSRDLTPTVNSIRVITDRKSYIEYLPAYYRKDSDALNRYLSIFQDIIGELESEIDRSHEMLIPSKCDSRYLEWLSSLLGLNRDYRWREDRWRAFLENAPSLYAGLGTKIAMQDAIEYYFEERPEIDDNRDNPFEFCVSFSGDKPLADRDIEVIESIIWAFKPAHTVGRLYVDYGLSKKREFIVGESILSYDTEIK